MMETSTGDYGDNNVLYTCDAWTNAGLSNLFCWVGNFSKIWSVCR